jgi:PKD repeat protein
MAMADEGKQGQETKDGKRGGLFKWVFGTFAGLLSGAAAMYVTALFNEVVKPARPLANFAVETEGLTATFHNRFAGEGWWDFGDGSELEPAVPEQPSITHTYPKPGTFTAKLTVRNFIGEEHDRTVAVGVTVGQSSGPAPAILSLDAAPISSSHAAPVTFRVSAKIANAERWVWDFGPDVPMEVATDTAASAERFITFASPGQHLIQVTALNGNQAVKKTLTVQVDAPPPGMFVARLQVKDTGTRMRKWQSTESVPINLTCYKRGCHTIDRQLDARRGCMITEAKLGAVNPAFKDLKLAIAPGGKSVRLTGSITPTADMLRLAIPLHVPVLMTQEKQSAVDAPPVEVVSAVPFPGTAVLHAPAPPTDCLHAQRGMTLELSGSGGPFWQHALPASDNLRDAQGRVYSVKATMTGNDVRLEITPNSIGLTSYQK